MKPLYTFAFVSLFALGSLPATAATFSVSSTPDGWDIHPGDGVCDDGSGHCPLRAAIIEANALPGHDTLALNGATHYLSSTYAGAGEDHCTFGDLDIRDDLTLTTRFGSVATIDGDDAHDRVFHVHKGVHVSMTNLRILNGTAEGEDHGGGVFNEGVLTMNGVEVVGNSSWNHGGGIYNGKGGTLTFLGGAIRDNVAKESGGGLCVDESSTVIVDFSTVSGNQGSSGAGIRAFGDGSTIVITNTTVADNAAEDDGGGMHVSFWSDVTLANVTVSGNTARWGGGIYNLNAQLGLINSTVTNNSIPSSSDARASGITNAYNDQNPEAGLWLVNTVIAGNQGGWKTCTGTSRIFSLGHNIDDDGSCNLTQPGDQPNVPSALLGPLASNGGPTKTHELLSGSPAIDTGDNAWCPSIDQRKHSRPSGPACDVGAYEVGMKVSLAGKTFEVGGVSRADGSRFSGCMEFGEGGEFTLDGFGSGTWQEKTVDERTVRFEASATDGRSLGMALSGSASGDTVDATGFDAHGVEYEIVGSENPDCQVAARSDDDTTLTRVK